MLKLMNILYVIIMIFLLVACQSNEQISSDQLTTTSAGETPTTLAISSEETSLLVSQTTEEQTTFNPETVIKEIIKDRISQMSIAEKVAQLFIIRPEQLPGTTNNTSVNPSFINAFSEYPVGGFIIFDPNIESDEQLKRLLLDLDQISELRLSLPIFKAVDEEGGMVARLANSVHLSSEGIEKQPNMKKIGESDDSELAHQTGQIISKYLKEFGFNLDFAPVADVVIEPKLSIIGKRSFGNDQQLVTQMTRAYLMGLRESNILGTYKHFPGAGTAQGDPHKETVSISLTKQELTDRVLAPFVDGIDNQVSFIMIAHIQAEQITESKLPTSLSSKVINQWLIEELGYEGLIITDALEMGAISNHYKSDQAAILAIKAGVDILLLPEDFELAYKGVISAIKSGEISEERIDQSLFKIIKCKLNAID